MNNIKAVIILITILVYGNLFGQSDYFQFQSIAKINGEIIGNSTIEIQSSIISDDVESYTEIHNSQTNSRGVFVLTIGSGEPVFGGMEAIDWAANNIRVDLQIKSNSTDEFQPLTSETLSALPYALYAYDGVGMRGDTGDDADSDQTTPIQPNTPWTPPTGPTGPQGEVVWQINGSDLFYINGNVGIGTSEPTALLSVAGDICYSGTMTACSDERYKINIRELDNAMEGFRSINVVIYNWKRAEFPERKFSKDLQTGIIAQEVQAYFPEIVMEDSEGFLAVDYGKLNVISIEAVIEHEKNIEKLSSNFDDLEDRLKKLESKLTNSEIKNASADKLAD